MTTNTTTTTITTTDNNEDYTSVVDLSLLDTSTGDINQTNQSNNPVAIVRMTQMEKLTSRQAFDERLKTFSPLTYYCKPTALSPIVCARFGYVHYVDCTVFSLLVEETLVEKKMSFGPSYFGASFCIAHMQPSFVVPLLLQLFPRLIRRQQNCPA